MDMRQDSPPNVSQSIWRSLFLWNARGPATRSGRVLQLAELEDRVLFSAAPAAAVVSVETLDPSLVQSAEMLPSSESVSNQILETTTSEQTSLQNTASPVIETATEQRLELVFVDSQVEDIDSLLNDLQREVPGRQLVVIELRANENGVERIAAEH